MSGTWVHVGALRVALLAAASPALQDAVIAGANRDQVAVLAWLNVAGCRSLVGDEAAALPDLARHPAVRAHVARTLGQWNAAHPGSSQQVARILLLPDLPSIDRGEITDKGYINQRLALEHRAVDVARVFAAEPDTDVIVALSTASGLPPPLAGISGLPHAPVQPKSGSTGFGAP